VQSIFFVKGLLFRFTIKTIHLCIFNKIFHLFSHSSSLDRSFCRVDAFVGKSICLYKLQSSTYNCGNMLKRYHQWNTDPWMYCTTIYRGVNRSCCLVIIQLIKFTKQCTCNCCISVGCYFCRSIGAAQFCDRLYILLVNF